MNASIIHNVQLVFQVHTYLKPNCKSVFMVSYFLDELEEFSNFYQKWHVGSVCFFSREITLQIRHDEHTINENLTARKVIRDLIKCSEHALNVPPLCMDVAHVSTGAMPPAKRRWLLSWICHFPRFLYRFTYHYCSPHRVIGNGWTDVEYSRAALCK